MNAYENLLQQGYDEGLIIKEKPLFTDSDALCNDNKIALNTNYLHTSIEKRCILSEEIWHNRVTVGDITDTTKIENLKQERFARGCSLSELVSIDKIVEALINYCISLQDMCEHLNITEECFYEALYYYKQKYGQYYKCKDYILYFEPLCVQGSSLLGDDENDSSIVYKSFNG